MATRRNTKIPEKTDSSNQPTAQELRAWFDKNKDALSGIKQISDPNKPSSKTMSTFDRDKLRTYMKNPYSNIKQLRNLSRYLFYRCQVYKRLIQYNANMINLNYRQVVPLVDLNKGSDKKKILKSYYETLQQLEYADLNLAFRPACVTVFREDVFYGCAYWDSTGFFILPLDSDFCYVSGVYSDGSLAFQMDMSYFSRKKEMLDNLGEPFVSMWNEYQKNTSKNKWQPFPEEYAVCLKYDLTDLENPIPPFVGMFDGLISLEDLRGIIDIANEQDIYKLLVAQLPLDKSGNPDTFQVSVPIAVEYFNKMLESLPDFVGGILTPIPIDSISFDHDDATSINKIENATKAVLNTSGGAQVLNSSSVSGSTSWEGAIRSDEDIALSSLLPQIQAVVNRLLSFKVKTPSRVKFLGVTTYTLDGFKNSVIKDCTYGVPNKLLLGTLNGFTELETLSMAFLENEILDLPSKFIPLQSSNTQDTSNIGRPTAKEQGKKISEGGEKAQDKRDRAK